MFTQIVNNDCNSLLCKILHTFLIYNFNISVCLLGLKKDFIKKLYENIYCYKVSFYVFSGCKFRCFFYFGFWLFSFKRERYNFGDIFLQEYILSFKWNWFIKYRLFCKENIIILIFLDLNKIDFFRSAMRLE